MFYKLPAETSPNL